MTFDLAAHAAATASTARYPESGTGSVAALAYVCLGLGGEAAEVVEKLTDSPLDRDLLTAELGDVLWYLSRLVVELGLDGGVVMADAHQVVVDRTSPQALVVACGRVQEVVKKALRDDGGQLSRERHARLAGLLPDVLGAWLAVHEDLAEEPAATAAANLAKLEGRKERGTLAGDGDRR